MYSLNCIFHNAHQSLAVLLLTLTALRKRKKGHRKRTKFQPPDGFWPPTLKPPLEVFRFCKYLQILQILLWSSGTNNCLCLQSVKPLRENFDYVLMDPHTHIQISLLQTFPLPVRFVPPTAPQLSAKTASCFLSLVVVWVSV